MIKGIENLTKSQREMILKLNDMQRDCIESPSVKRGLELVEVWTDENNIVCGKCKNGIWYHYLENGTWY